MGPRTHDRLFVGAWTAWAAAVLSAYYIQVLRGFAAPAAWRLGDVISALVPVLLVAGSSLLLQRMCGGWREPDLRGLLRKLPGRRVIVLVGAIVSVPWVMTREQFAAALEHASAPGLPWVGEAAARTGGAFIGAAFVGTAAVSAGAVLLRVIRWRGQNRAESWLFATVTGVGIVSCASLLLAAADIYRPLSVALLTAVLLLAGTTLPKRRLSAVPGGGRAAVDASAATWYALLAVALGYALLAALAPEKEYDALWYHLQLPRLWLEAGRPVDPVHEYVSLYPLTWELVFGAGMTFGGPVAAKLLHFACLPLLAAFVWQAARRFFPDVSPAAAAALVITTPTLLWESTTTYVDLALALHSFAACYALARYAEDGERAWAGVAAVQLGLAAATKHLGVIIAIIALGLFVVAARRSRARAIAPLRSALLVAMVAAAVPLPWYLRAWLASGNPVFPEMFGLFGASPAHRWDALTEHGLATFKAHFGLGRSPAALLLLPWNVTVHGALFGGSLGPVFLVLTPALAFTERYRTALACLVCGVAAYVAIWASPISSFQIRFLMPVVPALALLAAAALDTGARRAARSMKRGGVFVTAAVMWLALLNLPPFTSFHEADRQGWNEWLTHVVREVPVAVLTGRESEAAYLRREVPSFAAWQSINTQVPAPGRVLAFSGGDQLYANRPRLSHDGTLARTAVWGAGTDLPGAVRALRALQITHVLFDRRTALAPGDTSLAIASPAFQQACVSEYDDGRYWVCRVAYERIAAGQAPEEFPPSGQLR